MKVSEGKQHCLLPLHNYFLIIFLHGVGEGNKFKAQNFQAAVNHWAFFGVPLLAVLQDLSVLVDETKLTAGMLEGRGCHPQPPVRVPRPKEWANVDFTKFK